MVPSRIPSFAAAGPVVPSRLPSPPPSPPLGLRPDNTPTTELGSSYQQQHQQPQPQRTTSRLPSWAATSSTPPVAPAVPQLAPALLTSQQEALVPSCLSTGTTSIPAPAPSSTTSPAASTLLPRLLTRLPSLLRPVSSPPGGMSPRQSLHSPGGTALAPPGSPGGVPQVWAALSPDGRGLAKSPSQLRRPPSIHLRAASPSGCVGSPQMCGGAPEGGGAMAGSPSGSVRSAGGWRDMSETILQMAMAQSFASPRPEDGSDDTGTGSGGGGGGGGGGTDDPATTTSGITVAVRVRPLSDTERARGDREMWAIDEESNIGFYDKTGKFVPKFRYDLTFGSHSNNSGVFLAVAKPLIAPTLRGINGTIFAYGVTSSGKTHTIMGSERDPGIVPRAIADLFGEIAALPGGGVVSVRLAMLEIYNEVVNDLLSGGTDLKVREDGGGGIVVEGLLEAAADSADAALDLVAHGEAARKVGATMYNEGSSRSHTIIRLMVEVREGADDPTLPSSGRRTCATLCIIDLAGSESAKVSVSAGQRVEGGHINKSLLTLGTVIHKLGGGHATHVPFRDSKLTRMLQPSLSGNGARIAILCNITPASAQGEETHNTLKFATRAKLVRVAVSRNEVLDQGALIRRYLHEIATLRRQVAMLTASAQASPRPHWPTAEGEGSDGEVLALRLKLDAEQQARLRSEQESVLLEERLRAWMHDQQQQEEEQQQPGADDVAAPQGAGDAQGMDQEDKREEQEEAEKEEEAGSSGEGRGGADDTLDTEAHVAEQADALCRSLSAAMFSGSALPGKDSAEGAAGGDDGGSAPRGGAESPALLNGHSGLASSCCMIPLGQDEEEEEEVDGQEEQEGPCAGPGAQAEDRPGVEGPTEEAAAGPTRVGAESNPICWRNGTLRWSTSFQAGPESPLYKVPDADASGGGAARDLDQDGAAVLPDPGAEGAACTSIPAACDVDVAAAPAFAVDDADSSPRPMLPPSEGEQRPYGLVPPLPTPDAGVEDGPAGLAGMGTLHSLLQQQHDGAADKEDADSAAAPAMPDSLLRRRSSGSGSSSSSRGSSMFRQNTGKDLEIQVLLADREVLQDQMVMVEFENAKLLRVVAEVKAEMGTMRRHRARQLADQQALLDRQAKLLLFVERLTLENAELTARLATPAPGPLLKADLECSASFSHLVSAPPLLDAQPPPPAPDADADAAAATAVAAATAGALVAAATAAAPPVTAAARRGSPSVSHPSSPGVSARCWSAAELDLEMDKDTDVRQILVPWR